MIEGEDLEELKLYANELASLIENKLNN